MAIAKTASIPADPAAAIMAALEQAEIEPREMAFFAHGSTVGTNALITRRLPRTAVVATEGFRDVHEIRRGTKPDLWDAYSDVAPPYVRRRDRFEVPERIDYAGTVLTRARRGGGSCSGAADQGTRLRIGRRHLHQRLHERRPRGAHEGDHRGGGARRLRLHLARDPARGLRARALQHDHHQRLPGAGRQPLPGESHRPPARRRLPGRRPRPPLRRRRHDRRGHLPQRRPHRRLRPGRGGDGWRLLRPPVRLRQRHQPRHGRHQRRHLPDVRRARSASPTSGRSSSATRSCSPRSRSSPSAPAAAASPGSTPAAACATGHRAWAPTPVRRPTSGAAARRPTPTPTSSSAASTRPGSWAAPCRSTATRPNGPSRRRSPTPLGYDAVQAADAIIQVANANMADAVRLISIRRGYDPRDFCLVAFGGAGSVHAAHLARELDIPAVVVPPYPGITSALGCLLLDVRHDLFRTYLTTADRASSAALEAEFEKLEDEARERLAVEGIDRRPRATAAADGHALCRPVALADRPRLDAAGGEPRRQPGALPRRARARVRLLRPRADGRDLRPARRRSRSGRQAGVPEAGRGDGSRRSAHRRRGPSTSAKPAASSTPPSTTAPACRPAPAFDGPAIVEQMDSTVVVPPDWRAEVDDYGNIVLRLRA